LTLAEYRACLSMARRHARNAVEAADLLQQALLASVQAGRAGFSTPTDRAWLAGTLRHLAAQSARGEFRRRRRETDWSREQPEETAAEPASADDGRERILARLSVGTRRVAVLALCGLNAEEIRYALGLKPPAFRQRLTALRRALGTLPAELQREALALAYAEPRREGGTRLDVGLIRRALLQHVRANPGIGTHDPDGHLLAIRSR
jgi:DNA-directed RNA polymerase specialized sigma24 family protein